MTPEVIESTLNRLLPKVQKPARYVGGELNQTAKDWAATPIRVALGFPDIYDLGMPNNGLAILYDIVNRQPNMLAERVYLPWTDMDQVMREAGVPLYALESKRPITDFDVFGITLPYETTYTNLLSMLDLAGIPLRTADRTTEPIVVVGGHATFNPEPVHAFVDAVVVGEGEDVILEVANAAAAWRERGDSREALHQELAKLWGVYVPSLYEVAYTEQGTVAGAKPIGDVPFPVQKRIVPTLPPPVTSFIVPNLDTVHNRASIEIMRGCTRGCRFCHAGMITRPVRERKVDEVVDALEVALKKTGFSEVGLLSLSSSDYGDVLPLVNEVKRRLGHRSLNISLPSLRIESFSVDLMDALSGASRSNGFTLAPEAATERMRELINKPVPSQQLLDTAREIYRRGWHTIKLYFMIGHPQETVEDVQAIIDLAKSVAAVGREEIGGRAKVNVGVSTFVPKPHTPFQWVPCDTLEQIREKQQLLKNQLRGKSIKLSWNNPLETMLEAWLTRGDRRLADVIETAWRKGARFDAWREHFRYDLWLEAFEEHGLEPDFYTHRVRADDEVFPWDHIDAAVNKSFLLEDYQWSQRGETRVDCRDKCFACGILPKFKEIRRQNRGDVWECPDVGKSALKAGLKLPLGKTGTA